MLDFLLIDVSLIKLSVKLSFSIQFHWFLALESSNLELCSKIPKILIFCTFSACSLENPLGRDFWPPGRFWQLHGRFCLYCFGPPPSTCLVLKHVFHLYLDIFYLSNTLVPIDIEGWMTTLVLRLNMSFVRTRFTHWCFARIRDEWSVRDTWKGVEWHVSYREYHVDYIYW